MAELRVDEPSVLIVDDEKRVADAYALRLKGVADVTVAYGGEAALDAVTAAETPPDVVLIDRHMPGLSGDEVLGELRDADLTTRAVMVTAVDPDLAVLDLPFDDYLCKPVEREDLRTVVDQQCRVLAFELLGEYFAVESKRAVIESELRPERLADHDEFAALTERRARLQRRVERLHPEAEALLERFDDVDREGY
jgi:DNA-binding response OmpR family regulator